MLAAYRDASALQFTRMSDFTSITASEPLMRELRDRIARSGPMTFRSFMEACLYHPKHGYYTTTAAAPSRGGDFLTSPEVHPIFGALVARTLRELWQTMGEPASFDIVEPGAGTGVLARDILRWSLDHDPAFSATIHYLLVDRSPAMREAQQRVLASLDLPRGAALSVAEPPDSITGVILSNEFLDAFPVHRVIPQGEVLCEVFVIVQDGRFVDHLGPLSVPALQSYFDVLGLLPGDGCHAEVNLDAIAWMQDIARRLERGYILTFDYGYEATELYSSWRKDGTLLCFYRQSASSDPYQRIGRQDMTASIDFTTLKRTGEECGLATLAMTDQSSFLVRLGIGEGVAEAQASAEMEEYFARRQVVMSLIDPARLGRIKVLLQGKGVPPSLPVGFRDSAPD